MLTAQRQTLSQRIQQRADPQLLLTNRLLQMSSLELRQCVTEELAENPALETPEGRVGCAVCDGFNAGCPACGSGAPLVSRADSGWQPATDTGWVDEEYDPLALVEAPQTLRDHLHTQLRAVMAPDDTRIGGYLVDALEADGYLRVPLSEIAATLGVGELEVERVLWIVQGFDPTGVGARTLQECLLLQARALEAEGRAPRHLVRLLDECWKELCGSRWSLIARRLRIEPRAAQETADWLRRNLSPYPGLGYRPDWERPTRQRNSVRPDVVITRSESGILEVELTRDDLPGVSLNPEYTRLWERLRNDPNAFTEQERRHIREFLGRAQMFLRGLQDRKSLLRRVAECIVEEQEPYLSSEREEDMRPLTQAQLSSFLQVHESTVSRAVADKFLQLPSGRLVPLSHFFDRALSHRRLVANVVASENPASPYSDQEISEILQSQGVQIARRTVMKYREEMNILSSRQRIGAQR